MKLTNEELQKLIRKCDLIDAFEFKCALTELQQYREALRFKSFGELPPSVGDANVKIEVKHNDGIVYRADWWRNTSEVNHGKALSRDGLTKQGYIGWRYPIGDLLAEVK